MRYQGGKSKISKQISTIINSERGSSSTFVSLFCGTCSIESKIEGFDEVICNDKHEYLIEMLQGVQKGYILPDFISEEDYRYIRDNQDENKILTGFVGFGCSFGGKWFGGYAMSKTGRNYALESKKSLLKDMEALKSAKFICQDYRDVEIPKNSIIYADPPYNNTTGYSKVKFVSNEFWEYMRLLSGKHKVFISEQHAPDDFIPIWERKTTRTLDINKNNQFEATEKLFIHKSLKK